MAAARAADIAEERKTRVFLSYSRKDTEFAERLSTALEEKGYDVRLDRTDIAPGEDWQARLGRLIQEADTVAFVVSPASAASEVCRWEVAEAQRLGKRILPLVASATDEKSLPPELARLNFIFFAGHDFGGALSLLIAALETDLPWLREHTRLGDLALGWSKSPRAAVLRGADLEAAEAWIASPPRNAGVATDLHRAFIAASRKAATARQRNWIAGVVAVLLLSLGLTAWSEINRREAVAQRAVAEAQRKLAVERKTEAETQRREADLQRQKTEEILVAANKTAEGLVTDLAQRFRSAPGVRASMVKEILNNAYALQTSLSRFNGSDSKKRHNRALTLIELSETMSTVGDNSSALDHATEARMIMADLHREEPDDAKWTFGLAVSLQRIGDARDARKETTQAVSAHSEAISLLETLLSRYPNDNEYRAMSAVEHLRVAEIEELVGDRSGALQSISKALQLTNNGELIGDGSPKILMPASTAFEQRGTIMIAAGKLDFALQDFINCRDIRTKLLDANTDNSDLRRVSLTCQDKIADVLGMQGKTEEALAIAQENQATKMKLLESDPGNTLWQRDVGKGLQDIADLQESKGDYAAAFASYQESLSAFRKLSQADPMNSIWQLDLARALVRIGGQFKRQGNLDEALKMFEESQTIQERVGATAPDDLNIARELMVTYNELADLLDQEGKQQLALAKLSQGNTIALKLVAADPKNTLWLDDLIVSDLGIAHARVQMGALPAARELYERAISNAERLSMLTPTELAPSRRLGALWAMFGDLEEKDGNYQTAVEYFQKSDEILGTLISKAPQDTDTLWTLVGTKFRLAEAKVDPLDNYVAALKVVQGLKDRNSLAASDEWMIDDLKARISELQ